MPQNKTASSSQASTELKGRPVYVVEGRRTPYLKATGVPGPFTASDLAVYAGRSLFLELNIAPAAIDELILGCAVPSQDEMNIGRVVSLRLGCGKKIPAWTVQRNCASAMQAIDSGAKDIASGRHDLVVAGGTESMSHAPVLWNQKMVRWLGQWYKAKRLSKRLKLLTQIRPAFLKPVIGLLHGLTDPIVELNTGQTAENLAYQFKISRESMDAFALESHRRLAQAFDEGYMEEIAPIYDTQGHCYTEDTGLRRNTSMEKLAQLPPYAEKPFGLVTAGNSSQITDGATMVMLASEAAVSKWKLPVKGVIKDVEWAGLAPEEMGLGPVFSTTPILQRHHYGLDDIDYWEINEAFACQVLACIEAWQDKTFCKQELGLEKAVGRLDQSRLNVDGGAVALGHPVGASGARIVLHLLNVLERKQAKRGVATLCIGGGQGGAMLIERV